MSRHPHDWLEKAVQAEGRNLFSEHPRAEDLVLLQDAPGELSAEARGQIEDHLRLCDDCADDLARLRAAALELDTADQGEAETGFLFRLREILRPHILVPAASLALVAMVLFGRDPAGQALHPVAPALQLVSEVERGALPSATLGAGFSVSFHLADDGDSPIRHCRVTILDHQGKAVVEEKEIPAFDDQGSFLLALDPEILVPGIYTLVARDRLGETPFPFRIDTPEKSRN